MAKRERAGADADLPWAVAGLGGAEAVAAAAAVSAGILEHCGRRPGVFAAVGRLRAAAEELEAALALERGAEARDGDREREAVREAAALAAAVAAAVHGLAALPLPPELRGELVGRLQAGLQAWQDPFAADATGAAELAALRAVVQEAPPSARPALEGLQAALGQMEAAGASRDTADRTRRAAIQARIQAEARWQGVARELAEAAGPGPWWEAARPIATVGRARQQQADSLEDDWFG